VRIVVHLIDARSGDDVWSERFDKTVDRGSSGRGRRASWRR
jgi:TolB-like protein